MVAGEGEGVGVVGGARGVREGGLVVRLGCGCGGDGWLGEEDNVAGVVG